MRLRSPPRPRPGQVRQRAGPPRDHRSAPASGASAILSGSPAVISDGLRTLERVNAVSVWGLWLSAGVGVVALAYLLVVGAFRTMMALRRGEWHNEPLRWPVLCLVLLAIAPGLYLTQSFLAIGDPTPCQIEKQHTHNKGPRDEVGYHVPDGEPEHPDLDKADNAGKNIERILLHSIADVR